MMSDSMKMKKILIAVEIVLVILVATGAYFIIKGKPAEEQPLPTQLTVTSALVWSADNVVTLTATLVSNDNAVEGKTITWSATPSIGIGFKTPTTDNSGHASISFLPFLSSTTKWENATTLTFTASFAGDKMYLSSNGTSAITVTPRT
jgi:hypothetical protein